MLGSKTCGGYTTFASGKIETNLYDSPTLRGGGFLRNVIRRKLLSVVRAKIVHWNIKYPVCGFVTRSTIRLQNMKKSTLRSMRLQVLVAVVFTVGLGQLTGCEEPSPPKPAESTTTAVPAIPPASPAAAPTTQAAAAPPTNKSCPVSGDPTDPSDPDLARVTYNGQTYVLCCPSCADEFNADPAKAIKAHH